MATEERGKGRAALGFNERQTVFASRMMDCVSKAFRSLGTSRTMEDVIFWDLSDVHGLGLNEIIDKPGKFIEAVKSVFGEAGASVLEYKLVKEIQAEFNLMRTPGNQERDKKRNLGELFAAAAEAAWLSI